MIMRYFIFSLLLSLTTRADLRVSTFDVDVTPPVGSMMAYDRVTNRWDMTLRARGITLLGAGEPIVLCAVDWIGIANESYRVFQNELARAAGTSPSRVTVHALHQHDAPDSDFSAEKILKEHKVNPLQFESSFQRDALSNLAASVKASLRNAQAITHLGLGKANVEKVASNRRIMGPDGKVRAVRYTATKDAKLREEPEGVIDPEVSLVSFWNGEQPVAVFSYFATHPQSYYRTGIPNPDFPGLARFMRQLEIPGAVHIHFNGAGGNIGAGKYNDGSPANRKILADRLADGMKRAWLSTKKSELRAEDIKWGVEPVALPPAKHLTRESLLAEIQKTNPTTINIGSASRLAWISRTDKIDITCLSLGPARILHLPGELFVEYQLYAKSLRPNLFVAMAAYTDYGPWYIGTSRSYEEGGYETSPGATNVGPESEPILRAAIEKLLGVTKN